MTRKLSIVLVMLAMWVWWYRVDAWAQTSVGSATDTSQTSSTEAKLREKLQINQVEIEKIRATVKAKVQEVREKTGTSQAELGKKLNAEVQKRVRGLFEVMIKRQKTTVDKLEKILVNAESRLNKMTEKGQDTAKMEASLKSAKENLVTAKSALEVMQTEYGNMVLNSENYRQGLAALKSLMTDFKTSVTKTHAELKELFRLMKAAQPAVTPSQIENM